MNESRTEIRLNITDTTSAVGFWLRESIFKDGDQITKVEWGSMDGQFKVALPGSELRINISSAAQAIEYWANNYLFRNSQAVESVEWLSMDGQFKVILRPMTYDQESSAEPGG